MKSKIFSEILSEVTPEIELQVEQKTLEIMKAKFKPEEIYLNLKNCSEEQIRKVIALLPETEYLEDYEVDDRRKYLRLFANCNWIVAHNTLDKQELTYTQFIEMMGGESKEVLQVENNGWIKIESEADLPKDKNINYHYCLNGESKENFICKSRHIETMFLEYGKALTHYQPIVKPEPPKF